MPISKKQFFLLGYPLTNSLSPIIHKLFAKQFNLNIDYQLLEIASNNLMPTIASLVERDDLAGFNITAPYKEVVFKHLQSCDHTARIAGAVNTVVVKHGNLFGYNTDGQGLVADFKRHNIPIKEMHILILGAGGAVRGIVQALLELNPKLVTIINRDQTKTSRLIKDFNGLRVLQAGTYSRPNSIKADVIINATSSDDCALFTNLDFNNTHCYDLNYKQKITGFMQLALDNDASCAINGLGMLVEQAAVAFELWHGKKPAVDKVLQALIS